MGSAEKGSPCVGHEEWKGSLYECRTGAGGEGCMKGDVSIVSDMSSVGLL